MNYHTNQAVVVVLTGGIAKNHKGEFIPTSYDDSDQFGMLGGRIRSLAAAALYLAGQAKQFVFIGGKGIKPGTKGYSEVPASAQVYMATFPGIINELAGKSNFELSTSKPEVMALPRSDNTTGNIQMLIATIKAEGWRNTKVITSRYHVPRACKLFEMQCAQEKLTNSKVTFLSAEEVLLGLHINLYAKEIKEAYISKEAKKRESNEKQGLQDLIKGNYSPRKGTTVF